LTDDQIAYLRKNNFIEGRKPNFYLTFKVIQPLENDDLKGQYIVNRSFDDKHFRNMILDYLKTHGDTDKFKIEKFIMPKLSPVLTDKQRKSKVTNYLTALRKNERIESMPGYKWRIKKA
jgi:ATP-dependent DNA helicase RecG